jgi:hypothetical protein
VFARVEIIKEDPPEAAMLRSVGDVEVLVAPLLVCGEEDSAVGIACGFEHGMEVYRVLFEEVGGGQVGAAPEPPREDLGLRGRVRVAAGWFCDFEVAIVHVNGGRVGIAGMDDEAESRNEERKTSWVVFGERQ